MIVCPWCVRRGTWGYVPPGWLLWWCVCWCLCGIFTLPNGYCPVLWTCFWLSKMIVWPFCWKLGLTSHGSVLILLSGVGADSPSACFGDFCSTIGVTDIGWCDEWSKFFSDDSIGLLPVLSRSYCSIGSFFTGEASADWCGSALMHPRWLGYAGRRLNAGVSAGCWRGTGSLGLITMCWLGNAWRVIWGDGREGELFRLMNLSTWRCPPKIVSWIAYCTFWSSCSCENSFRRGGYGLLKSWWCHYCPSLLCLKTAGS